MGGIIEEQITQSFSDLSYARVIEEMGIMRSELIEMEEVGIYNEWVMELRKKVLSGELGGDRKELWREVAKNKVGLVEAKEVEIGGVDEDVARKVSFPLSPRPLRLLFSSLSSFLSYWRLWNEQASKANAVPCGRLVPLYTMTSSWFP